MDERELEQRLRTAVEHAAPDPLDRILASCGPQRAEVIPFSPPRKKRRWAPLAAAAALALVICGGAFDGIEGIIQKRTGKQGMGFGSEVKGKEDEQTDRLLAKIEPHDLMKFGLIPEFVGRVPICVSLRGLDREALIRILQEPKNALVKQYQKLFQMDHVKLDFEQDAIEAIADKALERKTGARGLRSIMESVMMDTMYEIPSKDTTSLYTLSRSNACPF